jgi:hypothetical protein
MNRIAIRCFALLAVFACADVAKAQVWGPVWTQPAPVYWGPPAPIVTPAPVYVPPPVFAPAPGVTVVQRPVVTGPVVTTPVFPSTVIGPTVVNRPVVVSPAPVPIYQPTRTVVTRPGLFGRPVTRVYYGIRPY